MKKKAGILLFSGGMDSTVVLAWMIAHGWEPWCITFEYGQTNGVEVERAKRIAKKYNVKKHVIFPLPLHMFGNSRMLEGGDQRVQKNENYTDIVPGRNTVFLAIAGAWGEGEGVGDIFIGVDRANGNDCESEYFRKVEAMEREVNKRFVLHTPLWERRKAEIIQMGIELGVDFKDTITCYHPDREGRQCGKCNGCKYRAIGFKELGLEE